jgi:hypothetical protein
MIYYNRFYSDGAEALFTSLQPTALSVDAPTLPVVLPVQTHTTNVVRIVDGSEDLSDVDALVTTRSDIAIGVRTADCVPIVLHAPDIHAVAAIHAGWRGTLNAIVDNTVGMLVGMGACPDIMRAAFGPSICCHCYEVDSALADRFASAGFASCIDNSAAKPHIDLQGVNIRRLLALGLQEHNIVPSDFCTRHTLSTSGRELLPSWRRTPATPQRLITIIHL